MENNEKTIGDFTRKSVVGAVYRVGASFALDAVYLTAAGALGYYLHKEYGFGDSMVEAGKDFVKHLDPWKLGRVAGFVVAINFVDYKYKVTEKLDASAKGLLRKLNKKD